MTGNRSNRTSKLAILTGIKGFDAKIFQVLTAETSEEVADSIMHEFRNTLRECIPLLKDAAGKKPADIEVIGKLAHRIKGSSHLVGLLGLTVLAERLRAALKASDSPSYWQDIFSEFEEECVLTERELGRIF